MSIRHQFIIAFSLPILFFSNAFAATINSNDLLISEVMANPAAVSDSNGEWFEIFNASMLSINLNGLVISDNGSNNHTIDAGQSLLIAPGDYFVLGNNGDPDSNGGYNADYVYNGFSLTNSNDQISIRNDRIEITRLEYSGSPFGIAGFSAELLAQVLAPAADQYGVTPNETIYQYGDGDFGTPGSAGTVNLTVYTPVPLPGTIWLMATALLLAVKGKGVQFGSALNRSNRTTGSHSIYIRK